MPTRNSDVFASSRVPFTTPVAFHECRRTLGTTNTPAGRLRCTGPRTHRGYRCDVTPTLRDAANCPVLPVVPAFGHFGHAFRRHTPIFFTPRNVRGDADRSNAPRVVAVAPFITYHPALSTVSCNRPAPSPHLHVLPPPPATDSTVTNIPAHLLREHTCPGVTARLNALPTPTTARAACARTPRYTGFVAFGLGIAPLRKVDVGHCALLYVLPGITNTLVRCLSALAPRFYRICPRRTPHAPPALLLRRASVWTTWHTAGAGWPDISPQHGERA